MLGFSTLCRTFAIVLLSVALSGTLSHARAPISGVIVAQADTCLTRRDAVAAVTKGEAVPLRQIRAAAESAGKGEMINAELCRRSGDLVYILTILSETGKVVYVRFKATNGALLGVS